MTATPLSLCSILMVSLWLAGLASAQAPAQPSAVPGFRPVAPGEHPRLFFRKSDVAELRRRAATPEGKMIVARCRQLLGVEQIPADAMERAKQRQHPFPEYTLWHGAGYGFLYQLTGDRKYADLARQCVDLAWAGALDRDNRYSLMPPNEPMRAGPSLYAVALAYDLCYDGWEPAYRKSIVEQIMAWNARCKKRGGAVSLERLALKPDNPNRISNHFGLQVGGAGLTILAIMGDPGADDAKLKTYLDGVHKNARKVLTQDFGLTGYFGEHAGPGTIASTWTFIPWLQAERVAAGRDWLASRPTAEWLSLRFVHQIVPTPEGPFYMNPTWGNAGEEVGYGNDYLEQAGGHHATYFCQGFGAISAKYRPAMLWVYQQFVQPSEAKRYPDLAPGQKSFDVFNYPHRAIFALVNWPLDVKPVNPAEVMPRVAMDPVMGQYVFRNRWQDANDSVVAVLFGARTSGGESTNNRIMIRGLGMRLSLGRLVGKEGAASSGLAGKDGSGVANSGDNSIAVDYSGASGADALIVVAGPAATSDLHGNPDKSKTKLTTLTLGDTPVTVLTLAANGQHPTPSVQGTQLIVGGQTLRHDGKTLVLTKFTPAPPAR